MRRVISFILFLIMLSGSIAYAGPFDTQDKEAKKAALFIREMLGGDAYESKIKEKYINLADVNFNWEGRAVPSVDGSTTFVVYCQVNSGETQAGFYYFEMKVSDINNTPELIKKYGIVV